MSNGVTRDEKTGKITIDLADLPEFSPEQLMAADKIFTAPIIERLPDIRQFCYVGSVAMNNMSQPDIRELFIDAKNLADEEISPDENGMLMMNVMGRMKEIQEKLNEAYIKSEALLDTDLDEFLNVMRAKMQTFFHPDKPYEPEYPVSSFDM